MPACAVSALSCTNFSDVVMMFILIIGYKVPVPATFTDDYSPITNLFSCDVMEKILSVVLYRAAHTGSKITPDTLVEEVRLL